MKKRVMNEHFPIGAEFVLLETTVFHHPAGGRIFMPKGSVLTRTNDEMPLIDCISFIPKDRVSEKIYGYFPICIRSLMPI